MGAHRGDDPQHALVPAATYRDAVFLAVVGQQGGHDDRGGAGVAVAAQSPADGLDDVDWPEMLAWIDAVEAEATRFGDTRKALGPAPRL